jgi:hypothetical protein
MAVPVLWEFVTYSGRTHTCKNNRSYIAIYKEDWPGSHLSHYENTEYTHTK